MVKQLDCYMQLLRPGRAVLAILRPASGVARRLRDMNAEVFNGPADPVAQRRFMEHVRAVLGEL